MRIENIKHDSKDDLFNLKNLIDDSPNGVKTFRYFNSRDLDSIKNHFKTFLYYDNNNCVGYGHLDNDNGTIWLGILISDLHTNKGFGKQIMKHLIESYDGVIKLTVDKENDVATQLYLKMGFYFVKEFDYYYLMEINKNK